MNWDYVAGFFDGEGHFQWTDSKPNSKRGRGPRIIVGQKTREVLDAIAIFLMDEGVTRCRIYQRPSGFFVLSIARWYDVELIITKALDKLIVKHEQARIVLAKSQIIERKHDTRPVPIEKLKALVDKNYTVASIAKILGFGRTKIDRMLHENDIYIPSGGRIVRTKDGLHKRLPPKYKNRTEQRLAYVKRVNNRCIECGKLIWPASTRCKSCKARRQNLQASEEKARLRNLSAERPSAQPIV